MKSPYLLPVVTAVAGFAIAWVAKPTDAPTRTVVGGAVESTTQARQSRSGPIVQQSPEQGRRPKEVKAGDFPLVDQAESGPKTRDEARMLRLTEALGLSIDQQGAIISVIEDAQSKADPNLPVIQDLTNRGKMIEDELAKILTPEQLVKFEELRVRERENRAEVRALRLLMASLEDIDSSPEQNQEVLERLRIKAKADIQTIPAAATLLLDKSMLPTNNKELSVDGVLVLAQAEQEAPSDPAQALKAVMDRQNQDLEEILRCFDGILTSGQMGQYQAIIHEQRENRKQLLSRGAGSSRSEPTPTEFPGAEEAGQSSSDDDDSMESDGDGVFTVEPYQPDDDEDEDEE